MLLRFWNRTLSVFLRPGSPIPLMFRPRDVIFRAQSPWWRHQKWRHWPMTSQMTQRNKWSKFVPRTQGILIKEIVFPTKRSKLKKVSSSLFEAFRLYKKTFEFEAFDSINVPFDPTWCCQFQRERACGDISGWELKDRFLYWEENWARGRYSIIIMIIYLNNHFFWYGNNVIPKIVKMGYIWPDMVDMGKILKITNYNGPFRC